MTHLPTKDAVVQAMVECIQCLKLLAFDELPTLAFTEEGHLRAAWDKGNDGLIIYFFGDGEAGYGVSTNEQTYTSSAKVFKIDEPPEDLRRAAEALQQWERVMG